jgi:hypothetical protein
MTMCTTPGRPADVILVGAATGRTESCGSSFPAELRRIGMGIGMGIGSCNRRHPSRCPPAIVERTGVRSCPPMASRVASQSTSERQVPQVEAGAPR